MSLTGQLYARPFASNFTKDNVMNDLRSALEGAFGAEENNEEVSTEPSGVVQADAPAQEPTEEVAQSQPVEDEKQDPPKPETVESDSGKNKPADGEESHARNVTKVDRAPVSWKGEAKKVWANLPPHVRQEVQRREREITSALNSVADSKRRVEEISNVLTPHKDRIDHVYKGDAMGLVSNLLNADRIMTSGTSLDKARFVAELIQKAGVDIEQLDAILSGQPAPEARQAESRLEQLLDQRLKPVMSFVEQQRLAEQQRQLAEEQEAVNTVAQMVDNPAYPHLEDVRMDMADVIELAAKRGVAISLDEAYNKAVLMNGLDPQTGSNEAQAAQAALAAHQAAQKAKRTSLSVGGSPAGTGGNSGNPKDLRGTIVRAMGGEGGRL